MQDVTEFYQIAKLPACSAMNQSFAMFEGDSAYGAVALIILAAHLALYIGLLRHKTFFQTERGIFLYHFCSFSAFVFVSLMVILIRRDADSVSIACGIVAAHGIYSISFLELWSLAQGSYSLSIMGRKLSGQTPSRAQLIDAFSRIGNAKKADRLSGLESSRLVRLEGSYWKLSGSGAAVAAFLRILLWLANIKQRG